MVCHDDVPWSSSMVMSGDGFPAWCTATVQTVLIHHGITSRCMPWRCSKMTHASPHMFMAYHCDTSWSYVTSWWRRVLISLSDMSPWHLKTMYDDDNESHGIQTHDPPFLCLAIWWDLEVAIANSQSQLGSQELSPGISTGILIRGFSQSQLESRAGICQHMLAYADIC